jgi:hypothetical protein
MITQAGLPLDCKHHGLHKAAGRMLAEARATSKMIMAVLGHMTLAEAERCYEEAEQAGPAEAGPAVEAAINIEAHSQPQEQPRASRESEHQAQAFRTSDQNAYDRKDAFTRKNFKFRSGP